jgi:SPASM domain peptide maturase of grasp-with-spasm system
MMSKMMLVSNCFPVKGYKRSVICDVGRLKYDFIPNSLYNLLIQYNKKDITEIENTLSNKDMPIFRSYIDWLLEKEYIFFSDNPELFPDIPFVWETPAIITNAIIDFDKNSDHDLTKIIAELGELRCNAIEIRSFDALNQGRLEKIIATLNESCFRSVNLLLKYHSDYTFDFFKEMIDRNQRIVSVIIHSTPSESLLKIDGPKSANVFFIKNQIESESHCGAISKFNFSSNMMMFMESQFHNNCLNKKISIDKKGLIKNCPSLAEDFGHHRQINLSTVVDNDQFKAIWSITKDQIDICKDCEFRYVCTDCRAYTSDRNDKYSKPLKCNYDPYTATWVD